MLKLRNIMNNNINRKIIYWIAAIIIVSAMCSPVTGTIASMLIMSQSVNSIIGVMLGVISGVMIACYAPVMYNYFKEILKLFLK